METFPRMYVYLVCKLCAFLFWHREICAVAAMIENRQAAASTQWALAGGSGFLFSSVLEIGYKKGIWRHHERR